MTGLIWLAFALRLHNLGGPSLWYDELLQLDIAQGPLGQIGPQLERHAAMPLDYYILHGWIQLARQETWVRFPALVFGLLAIPAIYTLAASMFKPTVGYLAAILLTWSSFAIRYSQEVRPYALLLLLIIVAYYGVWQAYKTQKDRYWVRAVFGLSGAALTHYFTLFMLLPLGLFVTVQQLRRLGDKRAWRDTAYFALCVLLIFTIYIFNGRVRNLYNVGTRFATVATQPETLTLPALEKPNRGSGPPVELNFFVERVLIPLSTVSPLLLLFYNLFFLAAVLSLAGHRPKYRAAILLLIGWLCLPIILIYLFLLQRGTFYAVRYILYTLPAYLILVAYGLTWLTDALLVLIATLQPGNQAYHLTFTLRPGVLFLAVLLLILAQSDELTRYYAADSREDWRAVGQLLHANAGSNDAVIAVKAEPAINWYYPPATAPYGALTNSEAIWQMMQAHPRRWFVLSSYSFKRDEGLRDWLREHHAVTIAIDRRVIVYFQQEDLTFEQHLAEVKTFALPQKALTYASLADQFKAGGDLETSQLFYQKAIELADSQNQKANYQARLAALINN